MQSGNGHFRAPITIKSCVVLCILGAYSALVILAGCAGWRQDETIGQGPVSLIFRNTGPETIEVRVTWTRATGDPRSREFDVEVGGRVELRLADRAEYEIKLASVHSCPESDCGSTTLAEE